MESKENLRFLKYFFSIEKRSEEVEYNIMPIFIIEGVWAITTPSILKIGTNFTRLFHFAFQKSILSFKKVR